MAGDRDEKAVGIVRVNRHLRNLLPVAQPEMRPGRAGVGGFVDAVADRQIGTMQSLAAGDINDIWIGGRDFNRPNRAGRLLIEDRLPRPPEVVGLPDTAIDRANVEDVRLAGNAGDSARAATAKRADVPPLHLAEKLGVDRLRVCRRNEAWNQTKQKGINHRRKYLHQPINLEVVFAES